MKKLEIRLPEFKPGEIDWLYQDRDPRVRRRPFSWRMLLLILMVLCLLSAANVAIMEVFLKMEVFSVLASMGVGTYWVAMSFVAAIVIHQVSCVKFDKPMRRLSRAIRAVAQGEGLCAGDGRWCNSPRHNPHGTRCAQHRPPWP